MASKVYRVCTNCQVPHYENCDQCYGFGVYDSGKFGLLPINAYDATGMRAGKLVRANKMCPECHSTYHGIPNEAPAEEIEVNSSFARMFYAASVHLVCPVCSGFVCTGGIQHTLVADDTAQWVGVPCNGCSNTYTIELKHTLE